jgi:predicted metal-dependent HD superfamily phosphohydrolase
MFATDFRKTLIHRGLVAEDADEFWIEIATAYSSKKRAYHNLTHLESLAAELEAVRRQVTHWDCIVFAIAYHDLVYSATAKDNEDKSAEIAVNRLKKTNLDTSEVSLCKEMILATKGHTVSIETDVNFFTDADLSILGKSEKVYVAYAQAIRKEYSIFPDLLYKPGRRKVLEHFLAMPRIFKTSYFFDHYENAARKNLEQEFSSL